MDPRECDAVPDRLDEAVDALEASPVLDRLDRIERQVNNLRQWLIFGAAIAAACLLLSWGFLVSVFVSMPGGGVDPGPPQGVFGGGLGAIPAPPGPVPPAGDLVTEETPLAPKMKVLVEHGNQWWRGEVLTVFPGGWVRIHYSGWSSSNDETVSRGRLRLPPQPEEQE